MRLIYQRFLGNDTTVYGVEFTKQELEGLPLSGAETFRHMEGTTTVSQNLDLLADVARIIEGQEVERQTRKAELELQEEGGKDV